MKRLLILSSFFIFLCACNTSDDTQPQQPELENFYALTVGNSWVYKNYKYNNTTQDYDYTSVIDSVSIVGTEMSNGNTYYKFRRFTTGNEANITYCNENGEHFDLFRDSLGYLINSDGKIKFTNNDYNERLLESNAGFNIYEILTTDTINLAVEAGTFNCINSKRYAKLANGEQLPAIDRFFYSNGKGLIYDTSSFATQSNPSIIRRLDSYEVQ